MDVTNLNHIFSVLDSNADGYISYDDICKANIYDNESHLDKYKDYIENIDNKLLDFELFKDMINSCTESITIINEIFNMFDVDNLGYIKKNNFIEILIDNKTEKEDISLILGYFINDTITYDELYRFFKYLN